MPNDAEKKTERALKSLEEEKAVAPSMVREETALLQKLKKGGKKHG